MIYIKLGPTTFLSLNQRSQAFRLLGFPLLFLCPELH